MLMLYALWLVEGLTLAGLVLILRRFRVVGSYAYFLGSILFGLSIGTLAAMLWPLDTSAYFNPLGVRAGDWLYSNAIKWIGDPYSDQAHYSIPWLFRVPQVYAFVSIALYGAIGLIIQWVHLRRGDAR